MMPQGNDSEKKEILMAGAFHQMPQLLNPVRINLKDIFDIVREYIPRRKYDVTAHGYNAIVAVVDHYFKAKKRSTEFANLFGGQTDKFLTEIYEELTALSRITINSRDLQGTLQIVRCLQLIAFRALSFPPAIRNNDNFTCSMAAGYLKLAILDALKVGLDDVGLEGIRALRSIGERVPKEYYYTTISLITDIFEIALKGIYRFYLVDESMDALVQLYHSHVKPYERDHFFIRKTAFEKLKTISNYYLLTNPSISVNCEGLSAAFSILNPRSIPARFINGIPEITPENFDEDAVTELFHFYQDIGEKAAESDSFLIHFIVQSIENIVIQAVNHFGTKEEKGKYEEILEEFVWLLSVYWRIYEKQPQKDPKNYITTFGIDYLVAIALRSIDLNFNKFAESVVSQITSVVSTGLKKEISEFTVPRLMEHLIKVGVVARKRKLNALADKIVGEVEKLNRQFLTQAEPKVPKDYFEKRFKEALHREMWDIYLDFDKRERITAFDSDMLFREMVEEEDIRSYLNEIEQKIYNRIIDDIHRNIL